MYNTTELFGDSRRGLSFHLIALPSRGAFLFRFPELYFQRTSFVLLDNANKNNHYAIQLRSKRSTKIKGTSAYKILIISMLVLGKKWKEIIVRRYIAHLSQFFGIPDTKSALPN